MLQKDHLEAVGPGWRPILHVLSRSMEGFLARCPNLGAEIRILQIKEKFGSLRVYYEAPGFSPEERRELGNVVNFAESLSLRMCETCGRPAADTRMPLAAKYGWSKTLCEEHHAERDAKHPARTR